MKLSKFFCLLEDLGRRYSTGERIGTDALTPPEITYARASGVLDVESDGCGTVPKSWLNALREVMS